MDATLFWILVCGVTSLTCLILIILGNRSITKDLRKLRDEEKLGR